MSYADYTADANDAPSWFYQIKILEELQGITFVDREGGMAVPSTDSILIYKSGREKNMDSDHSRLPKPGILLVYEGSNVSVGNRRGTNNHDDVDYSYQILIIDKDYDHLHRGTRTWQKWQDQIMRVFRHQSLSGTLEIADVSYVPIIQVTGFDAVDDVSWDVRDLFRAGVKLVLTARETRD